MNEKILLMHRRIARKILRNGEKWRELSIFTSKTDSRQITPEILAIILAEENLRVNSEENIILINSKRKPIETLLEIMDKLEINPKICRFSHKKTEIPGIPKIKLSIEKIREGASIFSKILTKYCDQRRTFEELEKEIMEIDDINDLSNLMIKAFTPPKIREEIASEIKEKIRRGGKMELITSTAGIIGGAIFNPMILAPRGMKLMEKAIKNMRNKSEDNIIEEYNPKALSEMTTIGNEELLENSDGKNMIILYETDETMYEPFQLFLTWNIIDSMEGKMIIMCDANMIAKISELSETIRKRIKNKSDNKIIYFFQDEEDVKPWLGDKSIIFEIENSKLMEIIRNEKATYTLQLMQNLAKIREMERYGEIGFVVKYLSDSWFLDKVNCENEIKKFLNKMIMKVANKLL